MMQAADMELRPVMLGCLLATGIYRVLFFCRDINVSPLHCRLFTKIRSRLPVEEENVVHEDMPTILRTSRLFTKIRSRLAI